MVLLVTDVRFKQNMSYGVLILFHYTGNYTCSESREASEKENIISVFVKLHPLSPINQLSSWDNGLRFNDTIKPVVISAWWL